MFLEVKKLKEHLFKGLEAFCQIKYLQPSGKSVTAFLKLYQWPYVIRFC